MRAGDQLPPAPCVSSVRARDRTMRGRRAAAAAYAMRTCCVRCDYWPLPQARARMQWKFRPKQCLCELSDAAAEDERGCRSGRARWRPPMILSVCIAHSADADAGGVRYGRRHIALAIATTSRRYRRLYVSSISAQLRRDGRQRRPLHLPHARMQHARPAAWPLRFSGTNGSKHCTRAATSPRKPS